MKKVLCIGSITTDIIVKPVDSLPDPGTMKAVDSVSMHVGGCAANAANDLARLGIPVTAAFKVGEDSMGAFVRSAMKEFGTGTAGIVSDPKVSTTTSIVCVAPDGQRSFLYNPGSAAAYTKEDLDLKLVDSHDIIFVAGAFLIKAFDGQPCAQVMKYAQEHGKYTVMDTAWDFDGKWMPSIEPAIPYLDLFMPSYDEAVMLAGETDLDRIADCFFEKGAKNVIIKTGKDGAYICEGGGERYRLPTYTHIKPVDTTGAGDSFCAGFLAGLAQGWSYRESGRLANAVGTCSIMEVGASTGIKSLAETMEFMKNNKVGE